jgi:hypothetical protein
VIRRYAQLVRSWVGRVAVVAPLLTLGLAPPAAAAPSGIFAAFASCPFGTPGLSICMDGQTTSGELVIGGIALPITRAITIQAGSVPIPMDRNEALVPPVGGTILSKAEQTVPGGLAGLLTCGAIGARFEREACSSAVARGATAVTASTEVVSSESHPALLDVFSIFFEEEPLLTLPARIHLSNPFLGGNCHIGSVSNPIVLRLTRGTTSPPAPAKPLTGTLGQLEEQSENGASLTLFRQNTLVDNTFAVPVAEDCGGQFASLIDPVLDAKLGLPSRAGRNTAILNSSLMKFALIEAIERAEA